MSDFSGSSSSSDGLDGSPTSSSPSSSSDDDDDDDDGDEDFADAEGPTLIAVDDGRGGIRHVRVARPPDEQQGGWVGGWGRGRVATQCIREEKEI